MITQNLSPDDEHPHQADQKATSAQFRPLLVGCIGVVYGDIGTSPLYAFRQAAKQIAPDGVTNNEILGILSLILWSLIIIVTLKYVFFLLRADNRGEGGILSLMALAQRAVGKGTGVAFFAGIIGAALFFGDAAITPAISVLSAMEGTKLITPAFEQWIMPLSLIILIGVFSVQRFGTASVSKFFSPITMVWFLIMAAGGLVWIFKFPLVLQSFLPTYALAFVIEHEFLSFIVMGSIFLAITGTEALYSDLGHFGRKPIQMAWIYLIFPCLALNYMGQGALLMASPATIENTFFLLFPEWALIPMVILATVATIIACQAVITGAYSMTQQAMQLGLLPRMEVRHTSESKQGQIYMPKVNFLLLVGVILLTLIFDSASKLASAYGIAVSGTMIASTVLAFLVVWKVWKKNPILTGLLLAPIMLLEIVFFSSNLLKVPDGGFVPLVFGVYFVVAIYTWVKGTRYLTIKSQQQSIAMIDLAEMLDRDPPPIVPGTAIFLTSDPGHAPETMMQNLKHNQVLHENNIILTILIASIPRVPMEQRLQVEPVNAHILRVIISFGFMETPNVPAALYRARSLGYNIDVEHASFFLGHRKFVADPNHGLPLWQDSIYIAMAKSAVDATDYFRIPPSQVIEIGTRQVV